MKGGMVVSGRPAVTARDRSVTLGKTFLGSQMKSNGKTKHMFLDVSECGESIFDTPDP